MSLIEAAPGPSIGEMIDEVFDTDPNPGGIPHVDIIASVGPATDDPFIMAKFLSYIDIARINLAQNKDEDAGKRAELVRSVAADMGKDILILMDVPGVKLRIGNEAQTVEVQPKDEMRFQFQDFWDPSDEDITPVQHDFSSNVEVGHQILLLDGKLVTVVTSKNEEGVVTTRVLEGAGKVGPRQGLNFPNSSFSNGYIPDDSARLPFVATQRPDYLVASYVQGRGDMIAMARDAEALAMTARRGAKIEDNNGMRHAGEIIDESELTVVARGDMGPEIGRKKILAAQLRIVVEARRRKSPVAVATGMMESMTREETASPADLTDAGLAAMLGAKVWLSAETAVNHGRVVGVVKALREQVDEYAGRAAMLRLALTDF